MSSIGGMGSGGNNWTGLPMFPASASNIADYRSPAAEDYDLGRVHMNLTRKPSIGLVQTAYGLALVHDFGSCTTTNPGFVASAATLNAPGDALMGSAIRYPSMSVPMPYANVQVQPVAQLIEPTLERLREAQRSLLTVPVSQRPRRALPAANPALYAAAIEGGYKPNAYLTDYHDPYGGVVSRHAGNNMWGIGSGDSDLDDMHHSMHPHIKLLRSLEDPNFMPHTQCGVPLG